MPLCDAWLAHPARCCWLAGCRRQGHIASWRTAQMEGAAEDWEGEQDEDDWGFEQFEDWDVVTQRMVASHPGNGKSGRDLWQACMVGDIKRVRYLVEVEEVNVNQKDKMDALPVYFCCLCGHEDVLSYLLGAGARLDDGTFEAHRCYYAALTENIKNILREAKAKPNLGSMDKFAEELRQKLCPTSFTRENGPGGGMTLAHTCADFVFDMPQGSGRAPIPVHRCVLAARCPYFDKVCAVFSIVAIDH